MFIAHSLVYIRAITRGRASTRTLHTPIVPPWNIFPMSLDHDASHKKVCVIYTGGTVGMFQVGCPDNKNYTKHTAVVTSINP